MAEEGRTCFHFQLQEIEWMTAGKIWWQELYVGGGSLCTQSGNRMSVLSLVSPFKPPVQGWNLYTTLCISIGSSHFSGPNINNLLQSCPEAGLINDSRPVVLSPFWDFPYQISCPSDIYIILHNSSKITVMTDQWNNVMVGAHHDTRNCIKGS